MNLKYLLTILDMAFMVLLIITITVQNKSTGLSNVFGGSGGLMQTRRGAEKWLFVSTVILAIIVCSLTIALLFVK